MRAYGSPAWNGLTPAERASVTRLERRAAADAARHAAGLTALRTLGRASIVFEPVSAGVQFKENQAKGMDPLENLFRTGGSTITGIAGGFLAGTACSPGGPVAAGGCGAVGAVAGSQAGGSVGGVVYEKVARPVDEALQEAEAFVERYTEVIDRGVAKRAKTVDDEVIDPIGDFLGIG